MLAAERQGEIFELLQKNGAVRVDELAERFEVSEMTIRRDLEKMEKERRLSRCHGGAVPRAEIVYDVERDKRNESASDAKVRMARYCFEHYVQENMVIYLDAGTTILELAKLLIGIPNLTVVTNDVLIASSLINSNINVLVLGGNMQQKLGCVHGYVAENQLENYRMDAAFVSSLCADDAYDVFAATESKVYFRRRLLTRARQTFMLMDSSKFGHQSLFKIDNLADYSAVITDKSLSDMELIQAAQMGIEWITV